MERVSKHKGQFITLCRLAWPAMLEQLLLTAVNYVDTAMVGRLGYHATAAVAINIPVTWAVNGLVMGISTGYSLQVAYEVGAKHAEKVRLVIRQAVICVLIAGSLFTIAGVLLSSLIPRLLGGEEDILPDACSYLKFYMCAQIFVVGSAVFSAIHRCLGNTRYPFLVNLGANLINVALNFCLIFKTRSVTVLERNFTIPGAGLGVTGASIATGISLALACLALVTGLFSSRNSYAIHWNDSFWPNSSIMGRAVHLGLPLALERLAMNSGQLLMTRIVTGLSTISLAANQISVTIESLCYLHAHGICHAATALVGQSAGAKDSESAQFYGKASSVIGFLFSCFVTAAIFIEAQPLAELFTDSRDTALLAAKMLRIIAVSEPFLCVYLVSSGVLRGAGDIRYPTYVSLVGMWLVRIPMAPLLAFCFSMGLSGIWLSMALDQVVKGLLCLYRVWRRNWGNPTIISQNGQESVIKN